jgi:hypothetical protein
VNGGTWSTALLFEVDDGGSVREWYRRAGARMPDSQVPVWVEHGGVDDAFRDHRLFD